MGLIQTFTNYFYPPPKLPANTIRTKAQRLTFCIKQAQYKLQQATFKLEQELVQQVSQAKMIRNKQAQKIRMELVIQNSQKMLVYDQIILALNKIMGEANMLQNNPNKISNDCVVAINSLMFVYNKMQLKQFVNLGQFIPEPHPTVPIKDTAPVIQKYLSQKPISNYDLNLYACQFVQRNSNFSLDTFNQVGHNFEENPVEPPEESPSAHMFAITLEDLPFEEAEGKMEEQ